MNKVATKFAIVALDGCYGSSLHGLGDVLVVANAHLQKELGKQAACFQWQFLTNTDSSIQTSNGLPMTLPLIEDCGEHFDVIFIPGLWYQGATEPPIIPQCHGS